MITKAKHTVCLEAIGWNHVVRIAAGCGDVSAPQALEEYRHKTSKPPELASQPAYPNSELPLRDSEPRWRMTEEGP